jgi:hypothetical protein
MRRSDAVADLRDRVLARDGHRCVLAPWAGRVILDGSAGSVDVDDLDAPGTLMIFTVPRCWGRLGISLRRSLSAGGAEVAPNAHAACGAHRRWIEDEPDLARELGGETPWWLVVRSGDPEWPRVAA